MSEGIARQFAQLVKELPQVLTGLLTPTWITELALEEERCRQHGAAVGLTADQVDEVMHVLKHHNRWHYFRLREDDVKERLTACAMGLDWRP